MATKGYINPQNHKYVSVATYFDCASDLLNCFVMAKKWCLALLFTFVYWVDSLPVGLGTLKFDNLDTDLDDLIYEVEEDLDDYSYLPDYAEETTKNSAKDKTKTSIKASGNKKQKTANTIYQKNHDIGDLKKFYKGLGAHNQGTYNNDEVYAVAKGATAKKIGIKGNEDRTYSKGSKTRGFHRIHHKDEYKKDKIFYENDETKGTISKIGGKDLEFKIGAGAGFNKGHFYNDRQQGAFGKQGYFDNGFRNKKLKKYSDLQDFDGSFTIDS